jgi:hypothetical protein
MTVHESVVPYLNKRRETVFRNYEFVISILYSTKTKLLVEMGHWKVKCECLWRRKELHAEFSRRKKPI